MSNAKKALRLVVYDATEEGSRCRPGLSFIWAAAAKTYRALGWIDDCHGARNWDDALTWLVKAGTGSPIAEIQFWGHGLWGRALIDNDELDVGCLEPDDSLYTHLCLLRDRLLPNPRSLLWFRTCQTLGSDHGHRFALAYTDFLRCTVAGHTHIISIIQSGLCVLAPGQDPDWPTTQGVAEGTPGLPFRAQPSHLGEPNTIICLRRSLPR